MGRLAQRRTVACAGGAAILVYLIAAAVSGRLSPLARLPLLDGIHTAPPYNWVEQPPDEAGSGQEPGGASERIPFEEAGNPERLVATADRQVSVNLPAGSVPRPEGAGTFEVVVEPNAAGGFAAPPDGFAIRGNVYRVILRSVPAGEGIPTLTEPGQISLLYPADTLPLLGARHDLLYSTDGAQWRTLGAEDQHGPQMVSAPFVDIGYYAAAAEIPEETEEPAGSGFPWIVLIIVVAAVGAVFAAVVVFRRRTRAARERRARRAELIRRSRSTKKRRR